MKPIRITEKNATAVEAALKNVNGTATTHTFTSYSELAAHADMLEQRLWALHLSKANRAGAKAIVVSGNTLPSAYSKQGKKVVRTTVTLERRPAGWFLIDANAGLWWANRSVPDDHVVLTQAQNDIAVSGFRSQYATDAGSE